MSKPSVRCFHQLVSSIIQVYRNIILSNILDDQPTRVDVMKILTCDYRSDTDIFCLVVDDKSQPVSNFGLVRLRKQNRNTNEE